MDNAASRENFASNVYALGVAATKEAVLSRLPPELSAMHRRGDIHIHDLEFFGQLYNCCTPTWYRYLQRHRFLGASDCGRIAETFDEIERLVTRLAVVSPAESGSEIWTLTSNASSTASPWRKRSGTGSSWKKP